MVAVVAVAPHVTVQLESRRRLSAAAAATWAIAGRRC